MWLTLSYHHLRGGFPVLYSGVDSLPPDIKPRLRHFIRRRRKRQTHHQHQPSRPLYPLYPTAPLPPPPRTRTILDSPLHPPDIDVVVTPRRHCGAFFPLSTTLRLMGPWTRFVSPTMGGLWR
ncbi:hypothetical protein EX30DRAFT_272792 [Ascodesmis nigricans]|uniref:Uncharacterized protein n=1 Tax=Ascodesmis nigricans TaxID=341454 RepID=A0A4S2MXC1_9PEZI|nr:hypothetical protein EX30DRAFT_272792 [Ascodesmis nigricans]